MDPSLTVPKKLYYVQEQGKELENERKSVGSSSLDDLGKTIAIAS
jgi:hypothetical protein